MRPERTVIRAFYHRRPNLKSFQERANLLVQQGNAARANGQTDAAFRAYREAIELVPAYASLHLVIGEMHFEAQRYAEAAEAFEAVVAYDSGHDRAWASLGQCRLLLDDLEGAATAFDTALAAQHENIEANYYGAMLAAKAGDTRTAADRLHRALLLRPAWQPQAREDPLLGPLFESSRKLAGLGREKRWWELWR
ncbi:MAG TPA: tetratricopeptide repeat protein [Anaerolineales bacterium]|nr:tetratricopeptide repeat protein [Anaerolineales bacterium]